jgi:hypothetical protein
MMEICRNKKTNKVFVHLEQSDDGRALMVTPHGQDKALEYNLFTEPAQVDDAGKILDKGLINHEQYDIYQKYQKL